MESRMYFLVLRNLAPIYKGIQAGHAAVRYGLQHGTSELYLSWANLYETFVLLDGGTSVNMAAHLNKLLELKVKFSVFREPDMADQITAIAFIVDETIYDDKKYPLQYPEWFLEKDQEYLDKFRNNIYSKEMETFDLLKSNGVRLRQFIKSFRLA